MQEFNGRVAVVTGAASGIGYAMAGRFAAEGMRVALADIHGPSLDAAAERLRNAGAMVLAQQTDVSDAGAVEALAERVYGEWGAVHVLCNNAGVALQQGAVWEHSLESWRWITGINYWGVVHGVRSFVPRMLAKGEPGHVVNTASMAGMIAGSIGGGPYAATKHAVVAISESLYGELKRSGAAVSASVLCPGWVNTDIAAHSERDAPLLAETLGRSLSCQHRSPTPPGCIRPRSSRGRSSKPSATTASTSSQPRTTFSIGCACATVGSKRGATRPCRGVPSSRIGANELREAIHLATGSIEQNLEFGRRFNDLWNVRDPGFWDLIAADAPIRIGPLSATREQGQAGDENLLRVLPDCRREILREAADGDFLIHHWRCSGHHIADGRLVAWEGCTWMRIESDRVVEGWIFGDPADPRLD